VQAFKKNYHRILRWHVNLQLFGAQVKKITFFPLSIFQEVSVAFQEKHPEKQERCPLISYRVLTVRFTRIVNENATTILSLKGRKLEHGMGYFVF